jgi:NitT/TauT family transport system substrate-binding protein
MQRKTMMMLFISLVFTVLFTGCGGETDELEEVRVAEVTRSIFYAPQYVALSEGFFEEEGLDVELETTWGGDTTMTALLSGGTDIALVGSETSIYVYQQGTNDPAVNFAQLTRTDGTFLVSRTQQDDFEWDDLKDCVFLGQRVGGMPQMVGEYVLKKNGIEPHKDLEMIQNVDFGNIPNAFASGTGEYVQLFEPQATMFEEEGIGYIVASFGEESGYIPYTAYMAKQSYLNDNEQIVQKFTDAIYRAQQWVYEQPAAEVAEAIAPYFEDTDVDVIATVIERYKEQESFDRNPLLEEEEWELLQDIIAEAGELHARVEYAKLVDPTFAETSIAD